MNVLRYSRGRNVNDAHPQARTAGDFAAFVAALDADRAPRKSDAAYVCGPLNGDGRRCAEGAEPRRWLALDFDRVESEAWPRLREWFGARSGCAWPTHSSKPEAPRERVIIELDRDATRAECLQVGAVLARDLAAEFGDAIALDESTFRGEQPIFAPPTGVQIARFFGEPLSVDAYLAAARELPQNAPERPRSAERGADLLERIERGEALHETVCTLVARLAARGVDRETIEAAATGVLERARRVRGARVDALAGDELGRMIDGALRKFAAGSAAQPLDLFRAVVAPPLDAGDFPPTIRDYAGPLSAATGYDPGALMVALLTAVGAATDDALRLMIDADSSWFESARLWAVLIGPPGSAKTPILRAALAPIHDAHRLLRERHAAEVAALAADAPVPPAPALYTNDATVEALSDVLKANPRGVLAVFEELDAWLGSHDCYRGGQGSKDRGEWLRLFDGGPHQVNRVRRGSVFLMNWGASIMAASTPAGLRRHARDLPPDGLLQRFLPVMVRPMAEPRAGEDTRAQIRPARERFEGTVRALAETGGGVVRMEPAAMHLFAEHRRTVARDTEAIGAVSEPLAGHVAKHSTLLARVALAQHAAEHGAHAADRPLDEETMARSIRLLRALLRHALALFDLLSAGGGDATVLPLARAVARSLVAGAAPEVTRRDLMAQCRLFRDAVDSDREGAVRFLVEAAWLSPVADGRMYAGRPASFVVHPEVFARFAPEGAALRDRRAKLREAFGQ